jgi:hypothetical protein
MPGGSTPQSQTQQSNTNTNQSQDTTSTTGANPYIIPQLQQGVGDLGNDPNFQASLAAGCVPQNLNFQNSTLPSLRSQFEGSARNLGGADNGFFTWERAL